jgi:hypothetical protein
MPRADGGMVVGAEDRGGPRASAQQLHGGLVSVGDAVPRTRARGEQRDVAPRRQGVGEADDPVDRGPDVAGPRDHCDSLVPVFEEVLGHQRSAGLVVGRHRDSVVTGTHGEHMGHVAAAQLWWKGIVDLGLTQDQSVDAAAQQPIDGMQAGLGAAVGRHHHRQVTRLL